MQWIKQTDASYALQKGDIVLATMTYHNNHAECRLEGRDLQIRHSGFWNRKVDVRDAQGHSVAVITPTKWYAARWHFQLYGREYELVVRNNPLAEYAVQQDGKDVVAYGLKAEGGYAVTRITESVEKRKQGLYELDLILWYCFCPIALSETVSAEAGTLYE